MILLFHFSIDKEIALIDHIYAGLFHIALVTGVYLNLRVMIPLLLNHKKYLLYFFALVIVIALMGAIHLFTFQQLSDWLFPDFYLISYISTRYLILYFSVYLILPTLLHLSKSWFRLRETERRMMNMEKEKVQAELSALKSQIHPHFLFNSLNNLYGLSLKQSPLLPDLLLKLSEVLRYMIYEANTEVVPLSREIQFIRDYVDIQLLRIERKEIVHLHVEGDIEDQALAPLIFINFIENAFKHGLRDKEATAFIHINILIFPQSVQLDIRNNAPHSSSADPFESDGIGLDNVRKRLQLRYPDKHHLEISHSKDVFNVTLTIDLL